GADSDDDRRRSKSDKRPRRESAAPLDLAPIQHGVFWFNGFLPLDPFVAWSPARLGDDARAACLAQLRARLTGVFAEPPIHLPPLTDFPQFGLDTKKSFIGGRHAAHRRRQ